jgi:hypothetical protein
MNDPIKEAHQLQQRAKEEGVDVFEILNREAEANPPQGPENPFLDKDGKPYHDTPEED